MKELARKEPAVTVTTVTALVTAIIGLLVAFGIDVSQEQQDAILGFIAAAFPLLLLLGPVIRQFVSPAYKVDDAYRAGLDDAQPERVAGGDHDVVVNVAEQAATMLADEMHAYRSTKPSTGIRRQTQPGTR